MAATCTIPRCRSASASPTTPSDGRSATRPPRTRRGNRRGRQHVDDDEGDLMAGNLVVIRSVTSYTDEGLLDVVRSLVRIDESIAQWLQEADPGRLVVVKPNWIQESHEYQPDVWEPVITHPRLLLAVIEALAELM